MDSGVQDFVRECRLAAYSSAISRNTRSALSQYLESRGKYENKVITDCVRCYTKYFHTMQYHSVATTGNAMLCKHINLSELCRCNGKVLCKFLVVISESMSVPTKHITAIEAYLKIHDVTSVSTSEEDTSNSASDTFSESSEEEMDSNAKTRLADKMMEIIASAEEDIIKAMKGTTLPPPDGITVGPEFMGPNKEECMQWIEGIQDIKGALSQARGEGDESETDSSDS